MSRKFKVEINTANAAFADGGDVSEISRILKDIAKAVEHDEQFNGTCRDINGNVVGSWSLK